MANKILIPTPLRPSLGARMSSSLGEHRRRAARQPHDRVRRTAPASRRPEGRLRNFVNVYVNEDDIRYLQREQTPLVPGDVVSIVPSVAGGTGTTAEVDVNLLELTNEEVQLQPPSDHAGGRRRRAAEAGRPHASSASAPAASDLPPRCIWRLRASAPSGSSTSTRSIRATCSGRSFMERPMSAARSWSRRARGCQG